MNDRINNAKPKLFCGYYPSVLVHGCMAKTAIKLNFNP